MTADFSGLDQSLWALATRLGGWHDEYSAMSLLTIRWVGLTTFAPGFSSQMISLRIRMALAVLMASVMVGATPVDVPIGQMPMHEAIWILISEFIVGAALGLCVSLWISAARSTGEWIALLAGLNIQTTYQPDWDGDAGALPTPIGRLFTMLGLLVFFAGRGPLRMMDLIATSLRACPLGQGIGPIGSAGAGAIFGIVGEALAVSILVAWPIILALAVAQMAVGIATKSRSVALSWSLLAPTRLGIGMLLLAAGFATASASLTENYATWCAFVEGSLHRPQPPEWPEEPESNRTEPPVPANVPADNH